MFFLGKWRNWQNWPNGRKPNRFPFRPVYAANGKQRFSRVFGGKRHFTFAYSIEEANRNFAWRSRKENHAA